jgi:aerobic C4-dicarboxylate transport protein
MALILGIDKFMSEARAITNHVGNCVAAVVLASWEKELDWAKFKAELARGYREHEPVVAAGPMPIPEPE